MCEMKDSGIEWVGKIPSNWSVMKNKYVMKKLKHICSKYSGQNILSLTMDGVIVRDLNAGGKMPATFDGYQYITRGNLLMCLFDYDVTPRCIGLINNDGLTSPAYSQFTLINGNIAKYYFYYYLMIDHTKALLHLAKNLRHSFTEDQLGNILTPVPPLSEQQKIADYLDQKCFQIDTLRADIEKQIEILEENKKSVITEAVTKGLNPNVEMKDSGIEWIGLVPKSWKRTKIKNITSIIGSGTTPPSYNTTYYENGTVPWIQSGDIYGKIIVNKTSASVTKNAINTFPSLRVYNPEFIIIAMYGGSVGNIAISSITACVNQACCCIKPNSNNNIKFLFYWLSFCKKDFLRISEGGGQSNISQNKIKNEWYYEPSLLEQQIIADYLDQKCSQIDSIISSKKDQIEMLDNYKKSLIYEYVTGKKEVV